MLRTTDYCKEYKNGNITIKFDSELIELAKRDSVSALASALETIDCEFIGETFCLSNYETGHLIHNCYSDLVYIFAWSDLEKLQQGKTVKIFARIPDESDRELIGMEGM